MQVRENPWMRMEEMETNEQIGGKFGRQIWQDLVTRGHTSIQGWERRRCEEVWGKGHGFASGYFLWANVCLLVSVWWFGKFLHTICTCLWLPLSTAPRMSPSACSLIPPYTSSSACSLYTWLVPTHPLRLSLRSFSWEVLLYLPALCVCLYHFIEIVPFYVSLSAVTCEWI